MATKPKIYRVLLQWDDESNAWVTYVPELGNISTYADTEEEALAATREMILGYIEAAEKENLEPGHPLKLVELAV
jgi:predicted RNase H-like HicB family nuclease